VSLRSALVDRATLLVTVDAGPPVEGRPRTAEVESTPFRCRFEEVGGRRKDPGTGRMVQTPEIMYALRDMKGKPIPPLAATDRIIIRSKAFPERTYQVSGDPEPMRGKSRIIGWTVPLSRVSDTRRGAPRT
jgi:hypothetical protein